jgi:hypothetical protein
MEIKKEMIIGIILFVIGLAISSISALMTIVIIFLAVVIISQSGFIKEEKKEEGKKE